MSAPLRLTLGVIFLILGVIGSLLPVLQGWIFFLMALLMFFPDHPRAAQLVEKIGKRYPRFAHWLQRRGVGRRSDTKHHNDRTSTRAQAIMAANDDCTPGVGRRD